MKIAIVTITLFTLIAIGLWRSDVAQDQENEIAVSGIVIAYDKWECSRHIQEECAEVFTLDPNTVHQVHRIRYGKDFMAIKVSKDNISGWVTLGKNVKIIKRAGT